MTDQAQEVRVPFWKSPTWVSGIVVSVVIIGLVIAVFVSKYYRERCGAHGVIATSDIRGISMLAHYHLNQGDQLPPTILA